MSKFTKIPEVEVGQPRRRPADIARDRGFILSKINEINTNAALSTEDKNTLKAPLLLQQNLDLKNPVGIIITKEQIEFAINHPNGPNWDRLVVWVGIDANKNYLNSIEFYHENTPPTPWNEVSIGGGGGPGVVVRSTPPPNLNN